MSGQQKSHILLTVTLVLIFIAAGGVYYGWTQLFPREPVTLHFASHISRAQELLINEFNRINEGRIRIAPTDFSLDIFNTMNRKEIIERRLRTGGRNLDIFSADVIWTRRMAEWALPLDEYFTPEQLAALLPSALKSCYADSTLYGIPFFTDVAVLFIRRDLVAKHPDHEELQKRFEQSITWKEFFALAEHPSIDTPLYVWQGSKEEMLLIHFLAMLYGTDSNDNTSFEELLQGPGAVKALETLKRALGSDIAPPLTLQYDVNDSYNYFGKKMR